jgi:hypothetical protein
MKTISIGTRSLSFSMKRINIRSTIFWDIMPCSPFKVKKAGFLFGVFFDPEDGGDMFLGNDG